MLHAIIQHHLKKLTLDINLHVNQELVALFGPSGAGKSITLQIIAGLIRPDRGYVSIHDRVLFDSQRRINCPVQERRVGYVTQDYTLFPHLSVADNIAYGLRRHSKAQQRQAVADMLDLMHLHGYEKHYPNELSGGQQQRVALARALVTQPDVLLLDEPFSALDASIRAQLRAELRQLQTQLNLPTLLVTHDLGEANLLADRMAVYHAGRVLQLDSPGQIMRRPANLEVARLTGTQNFFEGTVSEATPDGLRVQVGALSLETPPYPFPVGQAVTVTLRPEQVILVRHRHFDVQHTNAIIGDVVAIVTDGLSFSLYIRWVDGRLKPTEPHDLVMALPIHVFERLSPAVGQRWRVVLKHSAIHVMARS